VSSIPQPPGREGPSSLQAPTPTPPTVDGPPRTPGAPATDAPKPKRRVGVIVAISLLIAALIGLGVGLTLTFLELQRAIALIEEQQQELEDQRELIDQKETFSQAATEMMAAAAVFDGLPFSTLVDRSYHETLIERGWTHRWNPTVLRHDIDDVRAETAVLRELAASAEAERASNASGTYYERITDQLGRGFITTALDVSPCGKEAWGCVSGDDPFTVYYDHAGTVGQPYMTDFIRAGVAYHEYAHVLQFTNPEQTDAALESFNGNVEHMADCYALTYLNGWKLDHRIWVGSYTYWDISVGYGYECTGTQRQVIRDWVASLTYEHEPISQ
jgi:hypothetical protein